jgi:adenine-specific DNA glycosylase
MVFGESTIAVDTHIFRVSNRTGLAPGKNPRIVEDELVATTPDAYKKDAHHWLLLHGRYVCTARLPACPKCIISDLCEFKDKTPPKELPKSDAPVAQRIAAAQRKAASSPRGAGRRATHAAESANVSAAGRGGPARPASRRKRTAPAELLPARRR